MPHAHRHAQRRHDAHRALQVQVNTPRRGAPPTGRPPPQRHHLNPTTTQNHIREWASKPTPFSYPHLDVPIKTAPHPPTPTPTPRPPTPHSLHEDSPSTLTKFRR